MATNELVKRLGPTEADLDALLNDALNGVDDEALATKYEDTIKDFKPDKIVKGRVLNIVGDDVVVDVGYKSEGIVPLEHWRDRNEVDIGDTVEVLLESIEDDMGLIQLSKRRADRIRGWERVISTYKKGDVVKGRVTRKIKGGLLVDIGVPVFLPASQIDIRRVPDVGEWLNNEIEAKIIKIDEARMNIVVSRRKLLEEQREEMKKELFERLTEGDVVEGQVKNLADFGAFVDLGGIDGLLHITDLSWGRVGHPSEVVQVGQMVRVKVLKIDRVSERISLGLKQLSDSPWKSVLDRYPVSSRHTGKVVSLVSYGAFVKLEDGVEGLVHVSEMSWTKRVNHPSDVVTVGDEVEVMILDINREKQEISLGMKQTGPDPWTHVESNYPPGTEISGVVRNMTNYGAFIEIEEGVDGLLHVTDISWTKKIMHPSEVLKKGEALKAVVLSVDQEKKRVALGLKQLGEDPWETLIPEQFQVGMSVEGKVTKIANFGVFVELDDNLEGLLHVSELAEHKIDNPAEVVIPGQGLEVKIIKVDSEERKIGLSLKRMLEVDEATAAAAKAQAEAAAAEADGTEAKEKAEAPAAEEKAEAPAAEEKAEAPAAEEKAEAPAAEEKAEAPAAEEKAEAPAAEEKAEAPAAEEKADAPAAGSSDGDATESAS